MLTMILHGLIIVEFIEADEYRIELVEGKT